MSENNNKYSSKIELTSITNNIMGCTHITEAPYDRKTTNELELVFGVGCVTEKSETTNKSSILRNALLKASKTGNGPGIPDSVVYLDSEYKNPLIFIEVKAPGLINKAIDDLLHYSNSVLENTGLYVPYSIAISGYDICFKKFDKTTKEFIDIFIFDQTTKQKIPFILNRISDLTEYKDMLKMLYLYDKVVFDINIPAFSQDEIISFCVAINNKFHCLGIIESSRATILTYFLICCLDKDFINKVEKDKLDFDEIITSSQKSFKKIIKLKNFKLNKNVFASLCQDSSDDTLDESEKQNYYKYIQGLASIFDVIDIQIANDFQALGLNRSLFIERLIQSGNFLGDAYEVFHTYASGNDMGQYFTPRHAVDLTITMIEIIRGTCINSNDVIYDPSCGVGGFLCLALKHATNGKLPKDRDEILEKMGKRIYGSEIEPIVSDMARVNLLLRGDGRSGIVTGSSLDKDFANGLTPIKERFISDNVSPTIVLMNPPFPSDKSAFKSYDFIDHALEVSSDGAYIGVIIPLSVINGKKHFKDFRKKTLARAELKAVITLPVDLFAPKAQVDTAIVILKKSTNGHKGSSVIFASCDNDGLKMHKGKKQRISDFNTLNEFQMLKTFWMADKYSEVYEKFKFVDPMSLNKGYFLEGGEWSPYQWLSDNPLSVDNLEITRLSKYIRNEFNNAQALKNLGGKW